MGTKVGSYEAKTKLPEILRRVETGEVITITNRGKAIADLIPSQLVSRERAKRAISNLLKIKKVIVSDSVFKELRDAGKK